MPQALRSEAVRLRVGTGRPRVVILAMAFAALDTACASGEAADGLAFGSDAGGGNGAIVGGETDAPSADAGSEDAAVGTSDANGSSEDANGSSDGAGAVQPDGETGTPTFGGVYAGPGMNCTATGCYTGNPSADAGCSCPAGFTASSAIAVLDDRSCPNNNPPYGWSAMYVCYVGPFTPISDFGGFYQRQGTTCMVGNPLASNQCACPSGSQAIELVVDGSCYDNTNIGFCWNMSVPAVTFGGAYEQSDNASYGTNGCVVANPATGACSCPSGATPLSIRDVYGPAVSGCKSTGAVGGHLYVCTR